MIVCASPAMCSGPPPPPAGWETLLYTRSKCIYRDDNNNIKTSHDTAS